MITGLHERYGLTRYRVGTSVIVCVGAQLHTVNVDELSSRISALIRDVAHLSSRVVDAGTTKPRFGPMPRPLDVSGVLVTTATTGKEGLDELLNSEVGAFGAVCDVEKGPLWRVVVCHGNQTATATVMLSVQHVLADGRGTLNLFEALLADTWQGEGTRHGVPPAGDKVLDCKPGWRYILPLGIRELLPWGIGKRLLPPPQYWPYAPRRPGPQGSRSLRRLVCVPVSPLKEAGKAHGVPTVHGVLHTAAFVAGWIALGRQGKLGLQSESPISYSPKHLTGNFVGSFKYHAQLVGSHTFWGDEGVKYATRLARPQTKKEALYSIGSLALVPDSEATGEDGRTGWDAFFANAAASGFRNSFELSNLGAVRMGDGGKVAWAQTLTPGSNAINLDILGHGGNVYINVGWREADVPHAEAERWLQAFQRVLNAVARGEIAERATLEQVAAMVS